MKSILNVIKTTFVFCWLCFDAMHDPFRDKPKYKQHWRRWTWESTWQLAKDQLKGK